MTSPYNTSPVVLAITERVSHHTIDNGEVKFHNSDLPIEFNSESVPYPYTTPIKSIYDDEMDHILELLHSENDEDILDIDIYMLQA